MKFFEPNIKSLEAKGDVRGLIKALGHRNDKIRNSAIETLERLHDAPKVELLIELLNAEQSPVRGSLTMGYIAKVLGELRDARAIEPLIAAMNKGRFRGRAYHEALLTFGKIGGQKAIDYLLLTLEQESHSNRSASSIKK
jgi:HEAT repeat protein